MYGDTDEVRYGGPCRGRTYGPLIKSGFKGAAEGRGMIGHPCASSVSYDQDRLSHVVSFCLESYRFASFANTLITLGQRDRGARLGKGDPGGALRRLYPGNVGLPKNF
ncbi:hypothetical protein YTPLAS18_33950 [Nitrospira sp.]|nr:hypothetical protein YTPLAS18_33950 [Nitrospira sp.]